MTVIGFKSKRDKNQDLMVKSLEHSLALAKAGKFTTLLTIGVLEDRGVQCSCDGDSLEALGALRVADHRILGHTEELPPEEA